MLGDRPVFTVDIHTAFHGRPTIFDARNIQTLCRVDANSGMKHGNRSHLYVTNAVCLENGSKSYPSNKQLLAGFCWLSDTAPSLRRDRLLTT